ncbi:hypothetical protein GCM10025868_17030 [Angustibacter aerolatus]|uniref:Uncharacterized protein n=1 Tax=Angustibacter aerolatus TaxID=1162965 RepID=A0ABQ6JE37_9ACTN|nr:hypothetical protein GCM10025868_17030 [Angustibacter aerolatus]
MTGRRVRVLPDEQHADVGERAVERAQHVLGGGQVAGAGLVAGRLLEQPGDDVRDGRQGAGPPGVDEAR